MRVVAFVDGFNLYHAIDDLGANYLKWLDLRRLCLQFAPAPGQQLIAVQYFSAFATWQPAASRRHQTYVKALEGRGVTCFMSRFKSKPRSCHRCGHAWMVHEEKASDVRLALGLVMGAAKDTFDRALLITGDSDLAPAVALVRSEYPAKQIRILAPPGRPLSAELVSAAGGRGCGRRIERRHLEQAHLPATMTGGGGQTQIKRPHEWARAERRRRRGQP